MWQQQGTKARSKKSSPKPKKTPFHMKRVSADIKLTGADGADILEGRVVLNDLTPEKLSLFATEFIPAGTEVAISFEEPRGLYLKGKIYLTQDTQAISHILSQNPFAYRMAVKLVFDSAEEKQKMKEFCEKLAAEFLYPAFDLIAA